jgi:hypothetical protein
MQTIFLERSVALIPDAASLMIGDSWERIRAGEFGLG